MIRAWAGATCNHERTGATTKYLYDKATERFKGRLKPKGKQTAIAIGMRLIHEPRLFRHAGRLLEASERARPPRPAVVLAAELQAGP